MPDMLRVSEGVPPPPILLKEKKRGTSTHARGCIACIRHTAAP